METQLQLIDTPKDWRIDEATREIGRKGLASAREALRAARRSAVERPADQRSAA